MGFLAFTTFSLVNNLVGILYFCILLLYFWLMAKKKEWKNFVAFLETNENLDNLRTWSYTFPKSNDSNISG